MVNDDSTCIRSGLRKLTLLVQVDGILQDHK